MGSHGGFCKDRCFDRRFLIVVVGKSTDLGLDRVGDIDTLTFTATVETLSTIHPTN